MAKKMKPAEFVEAYEACGASTHGQAASMLGIGIRSVLRYVHGQAAVPLVVRRLLQMLRHHGVPHRWHDEG